MPDRDNLSLSKAITDRSTLPHTWAVPYCPLLSSSAITELIKSFK